MDALLDHEATVRLYLLIGGFGLVAVWESLEPRRLPVPAAGRRWGVNIGLTVLLSIVATAAFPVLSVGCALLAAQRGWGLLHQVPLPGWLEFVVALLVLDVARYFQHAMLHRVPLLWRLHCVHHSDPEYDCTTGLRFHPLEALVTVGLQLAVIAALGPSPASVLAFEALAIAVTMFAHGNLRLPPAVDATLRTMIVTPDMHRLHHSAVPAEAGRNYSGVFPWWDRLFGTYQAQPAHGHERMAIGIAGMDPGRAASLPWLLASPFVAANVPASHASGD